MDDSIRYAADQIADRLAAWRRHLHAHPEVSRHEEQTARFVASELRRLGYEPVEGIGGTYGLSAMLHVNDQPAIALRADMDALPIREETRLDYASTVPGVMHACGHDAHMAMLLGTAQLLAQRRDQLHRSVKLIFQGSEELAPGGAAPMIEAGILQNVAVIYGIHVWAEMALGTVGTRIGPFMASTDELRIRITGRGGHGAMPQQCVDPIVTAAHFITTIQTIVSRSVGMADHAVVSIGQIHGGTAPNVIPETIELSGTVRALHESVRATAHRRLREIAAGVGNAHDAAIDVEIQPGYPVLVNSRQGVERARDAARVIGIANDDILNLPPQGGGEDFAFYAQQVPAAFVFLGARNESKGCVYPHHHPRFNIDEDALPLGTALLTTLALNGV
jgi:amidohydrolase